MLPFELRRQTMARPSRIRIRLEEAEMAHGCLTQIIERAEAVHGIDTPAGVRTVVALPVERRLPALGAHRRPTLGEPQLGAVIAVLVDEGEILGAGNEARGKPVRREVDRVPRRLV